MSTFRTKRALGLGLAALALGTVTACAADPSGPGADGDTTLTFGVDGTVPSIDPVLADNSTVDQSVVPMYESLVDYDPDGTLQGRLATDWTVAEDAHSVTFTLRDGAAFHDGAPVTAEDVKYTFDRAKALGVGVAQFLSDYESAEVVSDTEIKINLLSPSSLFLGGLAKVYIVNSALVEKNAGDDQGQSWLASNEAGSGPYTLDDFKPNRQIIFSRYDDFTGAVNEDAPEKIVYRLIPESSTQREEMLAGNIDVADGIEPQDLQAVLEQDQLTSVELAKAQGLYVYFNTQRAPFDDPKVREGIRHAYDYQAHVATILGGHGSVASGVAPAVMDCRPEIAPFEQDLDQARTLLSDLAASGKELTLAYQSVFAEQADAATALQSVLRDLGVTVKLKTVDYPTYIESLGAITTTPDMAVIWDNPPTPDVGSLLTTRYHSKFRETSTNFGQYADPEIDELLDRANAMGDDDARCEIYEEVEQRLVDDSASMPVADEVTTVVVPKTVSGVELYPAHTGYMPQTYKIED
ncbi:ABC transporter substrate-binding protein [Nocardioides carbamazepini]|uniref:ABC transporter substrate-binding protein n=1 Tax=Nocardioides carbamazepini TaxID=2854259 RepID=UPI00214A0348|nr:ABC transporter substrate-binding protein [Nocardioides carbamazepini]MCR1785697.1 ABC transporter substrate-binding protein [Nocardioides carbamazepini]